MKLKELKQQVDKLVNNNLGNLEVFDENKIALDSASTVFLGFRHP